MQPGDRNPLWPRFLGPGQYTYIVFADQDHSENSRLGLRGFKMFKWSACFDESPHSLGIQSPKLRMVSWNLNTTRFGGDCIPLAHPLTRWARIPIGTVFWKNSLYLRATTMSFSVGLLAIRRSPAVPNPRRLGWCIYLHENTPIYTQMKITRPAIIEYLGTYIINIL